LIKGTTIQQQQKSVALQRRSTVKKGFVFIENLGSTTTFSFNTNCMTAWVEGLSYIDCMIAVHSICIEYVALLLSKCSNLKEKYCILFFFNSYGSLFPVS
jgi:hypothetical protein